jgi:hypothetical protein
MADIKVTVNGFTQEFDYNKETGTITLPEKRWLTDTEILEYEIGKSGLIRATFMLILPSAYSKWVISRNIKRYRKFVNRKSVVVTYKN